MRKLFPSILLLISNSIAGQAQRDVPPRTLDRDSAEHVIYLLKDSLRRLQYETFFLDNFHSADSIVSKDSVVVTYRSSEGKVIKKIVKEYPTGEGFAYESTEHYGTSRWPGFIEHKELARSSPDSLYSFKWWVYSYERFIYDSSGRKLAWIRYHPTMSRRIIWRTDYRYDSTGKQTSTLSRVPTEKFWD